MIAQQPKRPLMSVRQIEIMDLLTEQEMGLDEIAKHLSLSIRTIYFHLEVVKRLYETNDQLIAGIRYIKERNATKSIVPGIFIQFEAE